MNGDLHHIDDLFKSGIEGKEENPSPAVWENIEKELDKKDSRPRFFYWWNTRRIAAAVLIFLGSAGLFAGGYYLGIKKENNTETSQPKENSAPDLNKPENQQGVDKGNTDELGHKADKNTVNSPNSEFATAGGSEKASSSILPVDNAGSAKAGIDLSESAAPGGKHPADRRNLASTGTAENAVSPSNSVKTTRANGFKENRDNYTNTITRSQPVANSEKVNIDYDDININSVAPRNWEMESFTANSISPTQPLVQSNTSLPSAPSLNQPVTTKNIPVLNKRSSTVDLSKFSITPVAGLQFGSNKIVANKDPHAHNVKNDIDRSESVSPSISGGVLADLKIARNMTIQSGLVFTSRTIEIEPKFIKAERNPDGKVRYKFDCSAGTYYIKKSTYARPGDSAMTTFSTNELNYINIPLALTYHFGGKKFSFFATAGAGLNLLTDQYLETGLKNYNYDEQESIATNLKSRYFNGSLGAGINYRPFKKISFQFSPQYQFAISPMNENMPVKAYPRIFNLQAGMQIRL